MGKSTDDTGEQTQTDKKRIKELDRLFRKIDLEEIRLTEKGYFIYTNTEVVAHGNLGEYYRVKPLSDECRELTKKYTYELSFVNYNMLVTNWDADNAEKILMPRMFEDIYRVYTNEPFRAEDGLIPAEIYERVMTTCFPVSVEQVREYCGYHADAGGYDEENTMGHKGSFSSVGAVAFRDINDDGKSDIIVRVYYYSGAGPTGMVPRPDIRIFIAEENEFYLAEDMAADIEQHILAKDMTIETICN